jgi:DNA-binding response OmpR family regulator
VVNASVLIADADVHAARDLERELCSRGYSCVTVTSGREALAATRKRRFDVAVVDMSLRDLKGYQLIPLLKDTCEGTKVIFSTSEHSEQIEKTARETGIVFYAIKANSMLEILCAVSTAVRAKRREEESERVIG